jgi:hypothetical protein
MPQNISRVLHAVLRSGNGKQVQMQSAEWHQFQKVTTGIKFLWNHEQCRGNQSKLQNDCFLCLSLKVWKGFWMKNLFQEVFYFVKLPWTVIPAQWNNKSIN